MPRKSLVKSARHTKANLRRNLERVRIGAPERLEARELLTNFPTPLNKIAPMGSAIYGGSVTDSLTTTTEVDLYTLPIDASQSASIQVLTTSGQLAPSLRVISPSGIVTSVSDTAGTGIATISGLATEQGTYTMEIKSASGTGDYSLTVRLNAGFESETNDSLATAQNITSNAVTLDTGVSRIGVVGAGSDGVYYEWEGRDSAQTPTIYVRRASDHSLVYTIDTGAYISEAVDGKRAGMASTANSILFAQETNTSNSSIYEINATTGALVRTINRPLAKDSQGTTTLQAIAGMAYLNNELYLLETPTNSDAGASPVSIQVYDYTTIGSGMSSGWKRTLTLPSGFLLSDSVGGAMTGATGPNALYVSDGSRIYQMNTTTGGLVGNPLSFAGIDHITGLAASGNMLIAGYEPSVTAGETRFQRIERTTMQLIGQSFARANYSHALGGDGNAMASSPDYYSFQAAAAQKITVSVSWLPGPSSATVKLYGPDSSVLATGVTGDGNHAIVIDGVAATSTGTYKIGIVGAMGLYSMEVLIGARMDIDPNDSLPQAQSLTGMKGATGYVTDIDVDMYSVTANLGDTLAFTTSILGTGLGQPVNDINPRLNLFNSAGTLVGHDDDSAPDGRNARLVYTVPAAGTYKVVVSTSNGASGEYYLKSEKVSDAVAPAGSADLRNDPVDDTGISATDNITRNMSPVLVGVITNESSPTTVRIDLDDDGTWDSTALTSADNEFLFDLAALNYVALPVTRTFAFRATDQAGNSSTIRTPNITFDNQIAPPVITNVTTDTGIAGDRVTSDNTLTISGTSEAGSTVTVWLNGASQGTAIADGSGVWTFNAATKPDGAYTITATAVDVAGNQSLPSAPVTVTIDTAVPGAPVVTDFSTDSGILGDCVTNDSTLTIFGTAEPGASVAVLFNGIVQGSAKATNSSNWTFDAPAKPDGVYSITARATDLAGNVSTDSTACPVTIDTTLPAAPVISNFSIDSGVIGDHITNDSTLTIIGTAFANTTVSVYFNGTYQGTAVVSATGHWSFDALSKPDGQYNVTATSTNYVGNVSPLSNTFTITIDTFVPGAPTISGFSTDSGIPGDHITNDTTLTIVGSAAANAPVTVLFNSAAQGTTVADSTGRWSFAAPVKPEGVYTVSATQRDNAGIVSDESAPYTITIDTTAPATPVIVDFSTDTGIDGDCMTSDNTLNFVGTALENSVVTVFFNGASPGTTTTDSTGHWSFAAPPKPDGTYTITATAQDAAANVSGVATTCQITIDTTAPGAPTITGFSTDTGIVGDHITADNSLTVIGTAEVGSLVTVFFNGTIQGTASAGVTGNWTFDATAKPDGTYLITATATDAAGNISPASGSLSVTIQSAPSTLSITGFTDDTGVPGDFITADTTPTIRGIAEPNRTITIQVNQATQGTATSDASGNWTYTVPALLDGVYDLVATTTDTAGNTTTSNTLNLVIDSAAPVVPFATVVSGETWSGSADPGTIVHAFVKNRERTTTAVNSDGSWSLTFAESAGDPLNVTFDATDPAGNRSVRSVAFPLNDGACGTPIIDTDFPEITDSEGANMSMVVLRERAFASGAPSVSKYMTRAQKKRTPNPSGNFVQSLFLHMYDNGNRDVDATAATITFSPGIVILATITKSATLGGNRDDHVATASDADYGIFDPSVASLDWDKYSGKDRGLEKDRFDLINDGRNGQPAQINLQFSISDARDQSRIIFSYGSCFHTNASASVEYHIPTRTQDRAFQGRILGNVNLGSPSSFTVPLTTPSPRSIESISEDNGFSATDHVTSDTTPLFSGNAVAGSTLQLRLNDSVVDTVTADQSGHWSAQLAPLAPGNYVLRTVPVAGAVASISDGFRFSIRPATAIGAKRAERLRRPSMPDPMESLIDSVARDQI